MLTYLHTSPSAAVLADALRRHLDACGKKSDDPFVSPLIFVPNSHADVWLRRHWAQGYGIVLHVDLPYLEKGIRESFSGDWSPVTKDVLTMAIMAEFLEARTDLSDWAGAAFSYAGQIAAQVLAGEQPQADADDGSASRVSERRLWNYASLLAEHFDNYDLHRFDDPALEALLSDERLQGRLRTRVRARILGHNPPDGKKYLFLRDLLDGPQKLNPVRMKQVKTFGLHLFAFNAISPLHLAVLQRVVRESGGDLHVWQITPGQSAENSIVQRWTKAGRLMGRLVEARSPEVVHKHYPAQAAALAGIFTGDRPDPSRLRIVGAPSVLREVEMIYNSIIWHLAQDSTLRQHDIALFVPDLATYRPVIDAVFSAGLASAGTRPEGGRKALRCEYAGSAGGRPSAWATGLRLLLHSWDLTRERMYALLTNEAILAGAGLERSGIEAWFEAIADLGSFNGSCRLEGEPGAFSFARGLTRLRLGRVMGDTPWLGLVPSQACEADLAGRVMGLLEQLETAIRRLEGCRQTGALWREDLASLAETFLGLPQSAIMAEAGIRKQFFKGLHELEWLPECGFEALCAWADSRLDGLTLAAQRGGGVMIAGMQEVRPVPFRLVYIAGMGEGVFPAPWKPASSLDLLTRDCERFPGDIEDAERDRMLFVETLLAARDKLVISYCDRDILKDSIRYPSALVTELRQLTGLDPGDVVSIPIAGWAVTSAVTALAERFPDIMSDYIHLNAGMARLAFGTVCEEGAASGPPAVREVRQRVSLHDIRRVIQDPSAGILRSRHQLEHTTGEPQALEADEPFLKNDTGSDSGLWLLRDGLSMGWILGAGEDSFEDYLESHGREVFRTRYQLCDRVPAGFFGEIFWKAHENDLRQQADGLRGIRERVRAAVRAGNQVWSPFVFGAAPVVRQEPVHGRLLPAVPVGNATLEGSLPLVWLEDEGKRVCLFVSKKVEIREVAKIIPQLVVALPSVRAQLGLDATAEVVLVSPGMTKDCPLLPGAEQEACLARVMALLDADGADRLLPADKLLSDKGKIPDEEGLLLALQGDEDSSFASSLLNPAQILLQPAVPDTAAIREWCQTMLAPWIRMFSPGWEIPKSEVADEDVI